MYYTGDCSTENQAVDAVIAAQQVAVPAIQQVAPLLNEVKRGGGGGEGGFAWPMYYVSS